MKKSTHQIVLAGNDIFELAKNIKAWRNRYLAKHEKVEEARNEVLSLKHELLDIAQAMLNENGGVELRDPGVVNKEIARAEARLAKTEERNQADIEEMDAICERLFQYLSEPVEPESPETEDAVGGEENKEVEEAIDGDEMQLDSVASHDEYSFGLEDDNYDSADNEYNAKNENDET